VFERRSLKFNTTEKEILTSVFNLTKEFRR
jgi:hypothetical protein